MQNNDIEEELEESGFDKEKLVERFSKNLDNIEPILNCVEEYHKEFKQALDNHIKYINKKLGDIYLDMYIAKISCIILAVMWLILAYFYSDVINYVIK